MQKNCVIEIITSNNLNLKRPLNCGHLNKITKLAKTTSDEVGGQQKQNIAKNYN